MGGKSENTTGSGCPEVPGRFEDLDFETLWRGREKVISNERYILSLLMKKADGRRVLEIGTGDGRLTGVVRSGCLEYVGTDINPAFLKKVYARHSGRKMILVPSNLYHLPFRDNSFTTVVMIRVFNFLSRPDSALLEILRVLSPGGSIILSYNPTPSIATFVDDIKVLLRYPELRSDWKPVTFSRGGMVRVQPSGTPSFACSGDYFNKLMHDAGFVKVAECASGIEDYRCAERMPLAFFQKIASGFPHLPLLPTRFLLARKAEGSGEVISDIASIYCCPRCRNPMHIDGDAPESYCLRCGFNAIATEGLTDFRYFPDMTGHSANDPARKVQ